MAIPIFLMNKNLANEFLTVVRYRYLLQSWQVSLSDQSGVSSLKSKDLLETTFKKQNEIIVSNYKFNFFKSCCMLYLLTAMSQQTSLQSSPAEINLIKLIANCKSTNTGSILAKPFNRVIDK
jgi:hypothetical protein